jgi:hypothetical protein
VGSDSDGDTNDPDENITYTLVGTDLIKNGNVMMENLDALDFVYLDEDGNPTAVLSDISSVQITIIAKTERADPGYRDTAVYRNQQGTSLLGPTNDSFRRRRLTAEVTCRNLGL